MKSTISGVSTFSFFGSGQDLVFDAYIQYKEYIGFVKAMNSLKGMKLCCKDRHEDRSWTANIKVMSQLILISVMCIFPTTGGLLFT